MKVVKIHIVLLAIFLAFFFWALNARYPLLGHDYFYFWPRLLEGKWHFLRQSFAPLRFAPHLCGGFFQYGNPQDVYYSLPQFLSLVFPLWGATQMSIGAMMIVGYIGWVRFGKDALGLSRTWAHTLAIVVTANGFFFVHIAVGHLSFHTLPLISWMLWALFHRTRETGWVLLERATIFAAVTTIFLHSGTHIAWFIVAPLVLILLPVDLLTAQSMRERATTLLLRVAAFLPLALLLGASKLAAVWSLMRVLPRTADFQTYTADQSTLLFAIKSLWIAPQLPRFFTLEPVNRIHEESMFTSPVALVGCVLLLFLYARDARWNRWKKITLVVHALVVTAIILAVADGNGLAAAMLQRLPLFSSLRVPERFLVIISLLASIAGIVGCAEFFRTRRWKMDPDRVALAAAAVTVIAFIAAYLPLIPSLEYTVPYDQIVAGLRNEPDPLRQPVTHVENFTGMAVSDFRYFFAQSTGTRCYETIQSQQRETLIGGPVNLAWSGALNLYNPACIAYGAENNCAPGDRIAVEDIGNLEKFINGRKTTWKISTMQQWADRITVSALFVVLLTAFLRTARLIWKAASWLAEGLA